mmetsp:Transcript_52977/g.152614  ORF Transcript_52977/g.152614 Transcript_52977/m.152614 type:complete len:237 (+) Transcript_52977:84-794(+)
MVAGALGLAALLTAWAACAPGEALRRVARPVADDIDTEEEEEDEEDDEDLDDMRFMESGRSLAYPNGTALPAVLGLQPEAVLEDSAFSCFKGLVYGINLPVAPAKANRHFFYVEPLPARAYRPALIFHDTIDIHDIFMLFPALRPGERWLMIYRRATSFSRDGGWAIERLYQLGVDHPCAHSADDDGDVPPPRTSTAAPTDIGAPHGWRKGSPIWAMLWGRHPSPTSFDGGTRGSE